MRSPFTRSKCVTLFLAIAFLAAGGCCSHPLPPELTKKDQPDPKLNTSWNCLAGVPVPVQADDAAKFQTIYHRGYVSLFSNEFHTPALECHRLTPEMLTGCWLCRVGLDFAPDPAVVGVQASADDYKNQGFNPSMAQGHLASSADFSADRELMRESYLYANIAPQRNELNLGIWRKLEVAIRDWVKEHGQVYVITGVSQTGWVETPTEFNGPKLTIGKNEITIPRAFFKVIVWKNKAGDFESTCIYLPHVIEGEQFKSISNRFVHISQLEAAIGIKLFPDLDVAAVQKMDHATDLQHYLSDKGL